MQKALKIIFMSIMKAVKVTIKYPLRNSYHITL